MADHTRPPVRPPVLCLGDSPQVLEALVLFLRRRMGFKSVLRHQNPTELVAAVELSRPSLVLVDIDIGRGGTLADALEAVKSLRGPAGPEVRVIVLTTLCSHKHIADALEAGASGFICKSDPIDEWERIIEEVLAGGVGISRCAQSAHDSVARSS